MKKLYTCMAVAAAMVASAQTSPLEQRVEELLSQMTLQEKIAVIHAQSKFSAAGVPRLGIPTLWTSDGPHGVRAEVLWDEWRQAGQTNDSIVAFPALTCLAATWNPALATRYGHALGEEALYRGKHVMLGPGVNILRTPLNGRNFEYMGEDPMLASAMVVPYVQALQQLGVAACVKHYALNNDEKYRHQVNVKVSDRALHEIYLPAFRAAVQDGGAWAIMGAYNLYNDEHNCQNSVLLNDILKRDWAFDGAVISDWGGVSDTYQAYHNGLDLEFGTWTDGLTEGVSNAYDSYYLAQPLLAKLQSGEYGMEQLDDKVRRVLRLHLRTSMSPARGLGNACSDSHYATARDIAGEGIVLLKNEGGLLPIDPARHRRILVVGENAIKWMTVGGGSSSLKAQREVTPLDGLLERLGGICEVTYERGYVGDTGGEYDGVTTGRSLEDARTPEQLLADAVRAAGQADLVIMVGGLNKAAGQDSEGDDRASYALPYGQDALVEALVEANPNLVFVNISGNPSALPWADSVPAIVQGWFIGSESGHALADVLSGDVNPSGHLPYTWYATLDQAGAHALDTYPGTWRTDGSKIIDEHYAEDIYVGYRWTEHHGLQPLFPFGHGLSYTTFATANPRLKGTLGKDATLLVDVTNTGSRAGAYVAQMYVSEDAPRLERPVKELKGFAKVHLQPGETRTVTIPVTVASLSYYDPDAAAWRADAGNFTLHVGASSADIAHVLPITYRP